jgi:glycosyltransferase involved in cell wall biosynthesis
VIGPLGRRVAHKLGLLKGPERFEVMAELARRGPAALKGDGSARADSSRLLIAVLIPDFRPGSGGLATILALVRRLSARGHACSLWFEDPRRRGRGSSDDVTRRLADSFGFSDAPAYDGFEHWAGADVAVATGWETVAQTLLLPNCSGRAYLVQDYEPDFFPASAEGRWAEGSYAQGLHHITAGPWLATMLRESHGAVAEHFDLGVDHDAYRPGQAARRSDTIAFYARRATPRRAVPLGLLALAELNSRRPGLRMVLFGEEQPFRASFPYLHGGVLSEPELAHLYSEATVGIALSMTNYSRTSQEMMACGLPCIELDSPSVRAAFPHSDAPALAPFDPIGLAQVVCDLLDDVQRRHALGETGLRLVAGRTWERATDQVEDALRNALRGAGRSEPAAASRRED